MIAWSKETVSELVAFLTKIIQLPNAVAGKCSIKKMFLKISQNSQDNTCARASFLIKLQVVTTPSEFLKTVCIIHWRVVITAWKLSKYGVVSGLYFLAFGLNTERYSVSLRIQSECRKIRTRNNSPFGQFSRNVRLVLFTGIWIYWEFN